MAKENVAQDMREEEHNVNFFKPVSEHARSNMKLIGTMVVIWAVAVFGFQFLLILMEKKVPEDYYVEFEQVWPVVAKGEASREARQTFSKVALAVLGKNVSVAAEHKDVLKESLAVQTRALLPAGRVGAFDAALAAGDMEEASQMAASALGLEEKGFDLLMRQLLPSSLVATSQTNLTESQRQQIPEIMSLYLIHNRSALTDFRFLGFPFHYWYTAQFLLILFVLLCLSYAILIDRIHKKHGFVEE